MLFAWNGRKSCAGPEDKRTDKIIITCYPVYLGGLVVGRSAGLLATRPKVRGFKPGRGLFF
jgi:hypothetical protein